MIRGLSYAKAVETLARKKKKSGLGCKAHMRGGNVPTSLANPYCIVADDKRRCQAVGDICDEDATASQSFLRYRNGHYRAVYTKPATASGSTRLSSWVWPVPSMPIMSRRARRAEHPGFDVCFCQHLLNCGPNDRSQRPSLGLRASKIESTAKTTADCRPYLVT